MLRLTGTIAILVVIVGHASARAGGVSPFADVLVWHASQETSSIWSSVITPAPTGTPSALTTFSAADMQFDWNAGLRTGFAFKPDESSWDMKLSWTYFRTAQREVVPPGDQTIVPESFSGFLSGDEFSFTSAAFDWSLAFNTVDLEAGHELAIGEAVFIRPSLGLKAAIINQSLRAQWANVTDSLEATEDVDHDFWGIGPSFGIGGRWEVPNFRRLSLVGSFSGAFMCGVWNVNDTYQRTDPQPTLFTYRTVTTSMNDSSLGTLMLRYFLGLEWTHDGEFPVTAHVGYEMQWWANQQRLPTFQQLPMHGDLTLQGFSCGISVCF